MKGFFWPLEVTVALQEKKKKALAQHNKKPSQNHPHQKPKQKCKTLKNIN